MRRDTRGGIVGGRSGYQREGGQQCWSDMRKPLGETKKENDAVTNRNKQAKIAERTLAAVVIVVSCRLG